MDKYLMSSPTQLTQFFMPGDLRPRPALDEHGYLGVPQPSSPSGYEDLDYASELPDFSYDPLATLDMDAPDGHAPALPFAKGHSKHFSVDGYLQTPFHLSPNPRTAFQHLRNVSLDGRPSHALYHAPLASVASTAADPPLGTFSHLVSTSTFALVDLAPLLLLVLARLLLESPYSSMGAAALTPARRKMLALLSSSNLYATPLRGAAALSPGPKVAKTQGHRRNRLRVSAEPGLALLLALIANLKAHPQHAQAYAGHTHIAYNAQGQHQAYPAHAQGLGPESGNTPHQAYGYSPRNPFESAALSPFDGTPVATPHAGHGAGAAMYFTPVAHSQNFGGALYDQGFLAGPPRTLMPPQDGSRHGGLSNRADALALLGLDGQDDDACAQLRRSRPRGSLSRSASMRNIHAQTSYGTLPAQIDLLLPELSGRPRPLALKLYPASIDLAAITKLGMTRLPDTDHALLPPIPSERSLGSIPTLTSTPYEDRAPPTGDERYPNTARIHETSTTDDIAKFAEHILKLDMKRPIVVHEESAADADDPKKKHKCPLCYARFQRPEHVKRHLKSHSSEKPFQCDVPGCGRRFNRKDNLKAHLKKIHGNPAC